MSEAELQPGFRLGKCRILELVGEGEMGAVYKAMHISQDRVAGVRVLPRRLGQMRSGGVDRFLREARRAAALHHRNIVEVINVDRHEPTGLYCLVLEFVDGGSIEDLIRQQGRLNEATVLSVATAVARALREAGRQQVTHGDIKAGNVMLTRAGRLKLADVGLAKWLLAAPDAGPPGPAAGIHDLGATLMRMLIGAVPGASVPDLAQARPDVSVATARIVLNCLAGQGERDYETPDELLDDLDTARQAPEDSAS